MMISPLLLIALLQSAGAWSIGGAQPSLTTKASADDVATRRSFLGALATTSSLASIATSTLSSFPSSASATDDVGDELIDVYFGCGCFWHVQHEFVSHICVNIDIGGESPMM